MNLLVIIRYTLSIRNNIKVNIHILCLLGDSIGPQCVTIFLINIMIFSNCLVQFNAKLVGLLQISGLSFLYKIYDVVTLLEVIYSPPVECCFVVNSLCNSILGSLHSIPIIDIINLLPLC